MFKNINSNHIILIIMATLLFSLAAFSFYLLREPNAPLPFSAPPATDTNTSLLPSATHTPYLTSTSAPTRRTSYTPFATLKIPPTITPTLGSLTPETATNTPVGTTLPEIASPTSTPQPEGGNTQAVSPTPSQTNLPGEISFTGRIVQNATPRANVLAEFSDDDPPREDVTDGSGYYRFITLAPGTNFILSFILADNPSILPISEIASMARIEGTLPVGVDVITMPDLEISLNLNSEFFRLQAPVDGAMYSAAAISQSNPLQFAWTLYNLGESYYVELGPVGSDNPAWVSAPTTLNNIMWEGNLNNSAHITPGGYWWHVGVKKSLGNYTLYIFTQDRDILFNP